MIDDPDYAVLGSGNQELQLIYDPAEWQFFCTKNDNYLMPEDPNIIIREDINYKFSLEGK